MTKTKLSLAGGLAAFALSIAATGATTVAATSAAHAAPSQIGRTPLRTQTNSPVRRCFRIRNFNCQPSANNYCAPYIKICR